MIELATKIVILLTSILALATAGVGLLKISRSSSGNSIRLPDGIRLLGLAVLPFAIMLVIPAFVFVFAAITRGIEKLDVTGSQVSKPVHVLNRDSVMRSLDTTAHDLITVVEGALLINDARDRDRTLTAIVNNAIRRNIAPIALLAAQQISDIREHDAALSEVARYCTSQRDWPHAMAAVAAIRDSRDQDRRVFEMIRALDTALVKK